MPPATKMLPKQTAEKFRVSKRRCDAAQERLRYADLHVVTSQEAIKRSGDQLARLGETTRNGWEV